MSHADIANRHEDEQSKAIVLEALEKIENADNFEAPLQEGLDVNDITLVKTIYEKLRDYIQSSVLLSFLEQRRQIKSLQREVADLRKQNDRIYKSQEKHQEETSNSLRRIEIMLQHLQVPVEKGAGDYRTQRRRWYTRQDHSMRVIDEVGKKLGIKVS